MKKKANKVGENISSCFYFDATCSSFREKGNIN